MSQTVTNWPELYRQAILEPDRTLLPSRIDVAREAIQHRARQLWYSGGSETKERRDLDVAMYFLGLLRKLETDAHTCVRSAGLDT
jgi:hypothetical protein